MMRQLPEVGAEAAALLQRLREHLVLADVVVGHGAARELHRLLEVRAADLRHRVLLVHLATRDNATSSTTSQIEDNSYAGPQLEVEMV